MVHYKMCLATLFFAVFCSAALMSGAQAAQIQISNRLKVPCTLEAPNLSIPMDAKSKKSVTIDDALVGKMQVVCNGNGLDKESTACKQVIGGTGGSGIEKDDKYAFKYVKEVHVYAHVHRFLVCSFM